MNADMAKALEVMFAEPAVHWWRFVCCSTCNARRQEQCQAIDGPARKVHAARYQAGWALHAALWLLREHPTDVVGEVN